MHKMKKLLKNKQLAKIPQSEILRKWENETFKWIFNLCDDHVNRLKYLHVNK